MFKFKNLILNLNYETCVSVDKLIHSRGKTILFIDSTLYLIILYDTANPINRQSVFLNSKVNPCFKFKPATLF